MVTLTKPDMALFSDPASTLVRIPHLIAAPRSRRLEQTSVRFEGDEDVTTFRGEGRHRSYDMTARYGADEHAGMADLIDLFEAAHVAPDGRIQLRMNAWTDARLQPFEVVTVKEWTEPRAGGRVWDVRFVANTAAFTLVAV